MVMSLVGRRVTKWKNDRESQAKTRDPHNRTSINADLPAALVEIVSVPDWTSVKESLAFFTF